MKSGDWFHQTYVLRRRNDLAIALDEASCDSEMRTYVYAITPNKRSQIHLLKGPSLEARVRGVKGINGWAAKMTANSSSRAR